MKKDITITHYRYKASEVAELYKLAKDYSIDPDKLIKDRHLISTHQVGGIKRQDIFLAVELPFFRMERVISLMPFVVSKITMTAAVV